MTSSEHAPMCTDIDDVKLGEPVSWGHNPLNDDELSTLDAILETYAVRDSRDDLIPLWSEGKRDLMRVLGGHTLEANITCGDADMADKLLDGEFYQSVWRICRRWWEDLPYLGNACKAYRRPTTTAILTNHLSPTGEKLGKRIGKDLRPSVRARFLQDQSDLIARCKARGYVRLSVSPLELLTPSDSATFHTCHSYDGEFAQGNFSYLIDRHTVVAYYWSHEADNSAFRCEWPVKKWRQLMYVDVDRRSALVSRHYPNNRDVLAKAARQLLFRKLAEYHGVEPKRLISPESSKLEYTLLEYTLVHESSAYVDSDCFRSVCLKDGGESPRIVLPKEPVTIPDDVCESCRRRLWEDDAREGPHGDTLCSSCFQEKYFICSRCGYTYSKDDGLVEDGEAYCQSCYDVVYADSK